MKGATPAPLYSYCYTGSKEGPRFYYNVDPNDHFRDDKEKWVRYDLLRDDMAYKASRRYITQDQPQFTRNLECSERKAPQWVAWTMDDAPA